MRPFLSILFKNVDKNNIYWFVLGLNGNLWVILEKYSHLMGGSSEICCFGKKLGEGGFGNWEIGFLRSWGCNKSLTKINLPPLY